MDTNRAAAIIHDVLAELEEEFGFDPPVEDVDPYGVYLTYVGEKAGMRVSYEPEEGGIFLMVFPLIDGAVPPYSNWYDFIDLLRAKDVQPEKLPIECSREIAVDQLHRTLGHLKDSVRSHAADFLRGDFSLRKKMDHLIAKRKKQLRR